MRKYLDLVAIQAKVNIKQSRMTRICIFLSVFLIMGLFGMADMSIQSQKIQAIQKDGSWHAVFKGLSAEQTAILAARPEIEAYARYNARNYRLDEAWQIEGKQIVICGFDEALMEMLPDAEITEGNFPKGEREIVCSDSIQKRLHLSYGDEITITTPDGMLLTFTISGFTHTTSMLTKADAFGVFVNPETYRDIFMEGDPNTTESAVYVQFIPFCRIQRAIRTICEQMGVSADRVGQNALLLGLCFQSNDTYLVQLYLVVLVIAGLVAVAGILMITGSLNSSVTQRTEFFGVMRCLGATPAQVAGFVRKEALGWCKTAIPAALLVSTVVIWGLCALLRFISSGFFGDLPVFGISWIGIAAGTGIGIVTVLLAARAPAKRASRVSPLTAVSGNAGTVYAAKHAADVRWFRVETALGIHHARGSFKNLLLMSGSFAFGIILFLSFCTLHAFMDHALTPLRPEAPDLSMVSPDNTCSIPLELAEKLKDHPAVKRVYGRSFVYEVEAEWNGQKGKVILVSYEENQLQWAKKELSAGTTEEIPKGSSVLVSRQKTGALNPGDRISLFTESGTWELPVSGVLKDSPFAEESGTKTVFCSEELFQKLTKENGYTIIDVQVRRGTTDEDAEELRVLAGDDVLFSDQRMSNMEVMGAYYAFLLFLYGFLILILMISAFHIINSMSMSVSAQMKQYKSLYAIGMSFAQLLKMAAAEAGTYLFFGILAGVPAGLFLHRFLFRIMVTSRWGDRWEIPATELLVVLVLLILSTVISLYGPSKRIRTMSCFSHVGRCHPGANR